MRPVVVEEEIITGPADDREDHERDDEKPRALLFLDLGFLPGRCS